MCDVEWVVTSVSHMCRERSEVWLLGTCDSLLKFSGEDFVFQNCENFQVLKFDLLVT